MRVSQTSMNNFIKRVRNNLLDGSIYEQRLLRKLQKSRVINTKVIEKLETRFFVLRYEEENARVTNGEYDKECSMNKVLLYLLLYLRVNRENKIAMFIEF